MKYTTEELIFRLVSHWQWGVDARGDDKGPGVTDCEAVVKSGYGYQYRDAIADRLLVVDMLVQFLRDIRKDWNWATTPAFIDGFLEKLDL